MANSSMLAFPSMTAPAALQLRHHGGVVGRDEIVEHARPAARAHPVGAENILMNEGDTQQRPPLAGGQPPIRRGGGRERPIGRDGD